MSNVIEKSDKKDIDILVAALAAKIKDIGERNGWQELPICLSHSVINLIDQSYTPGEFVDYVDILGFLRIVDNVYYDRLKKTEKNCELFKKGK